MLSDVIGNNLDLIASGPTVADYSTPRQCLDLFITLDIINKVPHSVRTYLENENIKRNAGRVPSSFLPKGMHNVHVASPKMGPQPNHDCSNAHNVLVGSNQIAVDSAVKQAEQLGYLTYILAIDLHGQAEEVGQMLSALAEYICRAMGNKIDPSLARSLAHEELDLIRRGLSKNTINDIVRLTHRACNCEKPICILAAGETTVKVKGAGKGGRCQEMSMAAGIELDRRIHEMDVCCDFDVLLLNAGSDGQDGPCDAAGAMVDAHLITESVRQNIDPKFYLDKSDSYGFFSTFKGGQDLIKTGMTGTNVMDLHILMIKPKELPKYQSK